MIRHNGITIDTKRRCVERGGRTCHFPPLRFRLMHALLLAGPKTGKELAALLYRDNDDGGPVTWQRCIDVHLYNLKNSIAALGLELHREGPHTFTRYWLAPSAVDARVAA
jgi:DNA-binding response OmpR family regulator